MLLKGETHRRQRKVMLPGFGGAPSTCFSCMSSVSDVDLVAPESKAFIPIFRKVGAEVNVDPSL